MYVQISFDFKRNRHRNEFHPIVLCFYINIEWNEAKNVEVAWITRWISHPLMPLAYNKEHATIRVGVQFRTALQLKQCQYFVFAYQNPYRRGIINFIVFWKRRNLTQILVMSYSSRNSFTLWTSTFHSISREIATETSSIQSYCVSTSI